MSCKITVENNRSTLHYTSVCKYVCHQVYKHFPSFQKKEISEINILTPHLLKGTSRQRSGKGAIRKRFPLQKPRWEKTKLTIRYLYHETIVSRMGSYFPNRWPLSYLNLTKNMKTYIRRQQHKKFFKHQDIKQKEPPQKYRLGTISNTKLLAGLNWFYMAITSPSASAVVHYI